MHHPHEHRMGDYIPHHDVSTEKVNAVALWLYV